jgi:hypothetical protein
MLKKGKWQGAGLSDSLHAAFNCCDDFGEIAGASIPHFPPFHISPECINWIQIRRVAWQPLLAKPTALSGQVLLHHLTLVRRQPVPHQDGLLAAQVSSEILKKNYQAFRVIAPLPGLEIQSATTPVPAKPQGGTNRNCRPVECMDQNGGFPLRRPSPSDRGTL